MDTMQMPHAQALFQTFHFREQQFVFEWRGTPVSCIIFLFCFVIIISSSSIRISII